MFRNMATSFLAHEQIQTTLPKAKDLRGVVERLVTLAKEDTLHRRRQAYGYLQDKKVVHKLFAEIGPRYKERPGGYTRVVRTGARPGDAAEMAVIQLVEAEMKTKAPKKKRKAAEPKKEAKKEAAPVEAEEAVAETVEAEATADVEAGKEE
jgi:large subunit ribosomal protein L17